MLALSVASYGLALTSPIYTDEIGWKLIQGHFVDDGHLSRSSDLVPSCGADTFSTPAPLVPIRYVNALITDSLSQPSDIRLYGLFLSLAWASTTWLLLRKLLAPEVSGEQVAVGLVGVVTLGVMPLIMVMSRPEQVLLIGVSVFLILALGERPSRQRPFLRELVLASALVIGSALVLGSHPRAILTLPVIVVACVRVIQRRTISFAVAAIVTVFAFVAFTDFSARLACPDDESVRNAFAFESIGLAAANHMLGEFFQRLASVLVETPGAFYFVTQFGFNDSYASQIIPPYPYREAGFALTVLIAAFVAGLVLTGIAAFILAAATRIRKRQGLVALAGLASTWALPLASMFARTTRYNYEAQLIEPVLVLASVLSIWFAREELSKLLGQPRLVRYVRAGFGGLLVLSVASQIALLAGYAPIARLAWSGGGYVSRQPLSVSVGGFPRLRDTILAAAAACNIRPGNTTQHLVVDELTFFAFRHTNTPYLMTYIHPNYWGGGISDLPAFLARKRSAGVIVGCQWIVPEFVSVAQTNGFCCVPSFSEWLAH